MNKHSIVTLGYHNMYMYVIKCDLSFSGVHITLFSILSFLKELSLMQSSKSYINVFNSS